MATPGGHLDLLIGLRELFAAYRRVWVVSPGSFAEALAADGEEVVLLPRFHGLKRRNVRLALRSLRPALRERPRLVVTSGSGSVVPFCLAAKALGARIVFIETMARVTDASDTGRLLSPLAEVTLIQWPEMARVYPGAKICRPEMLDALHMRLGAPRGGEGTFVAVGTHIEPFDRLLALVDLAVDEGTLPLPVIAQSGVSSYQPRRYTPVSWMRPHEIDRALGQVRHVVCHAGSGLIARALNAGITPLVVGRLQRYGEHVDDHQLQLVRKLSELGLVVSVEGQLTAAHVRATTMPTRSSMSDLTTFPPMADVLSAVLRASVEEVTASAMPVHQAASPYRRLAVAASAVVSSAKAERVATTESKILSSKMSPVRPALAEGRHGERALQGLRWVGPSGST